MLYNIVLALYKYLFTEYGMPHRDVRGGLFSIEVRYHSISCVVRCAYVRRMGHGSTNTRLLAN